MFKAEYQVIGFWFNLQGCVCCHVGVCVCCLDKFSYCCTSRKWGDLFLTLGSTSFLVLLANTIYFMHIVMFVHAHNTYVSIATRADCDCVLQYNPSFFYKIQKDACINQKEWAGAKKKIRNYGRIAIFKAEYQVTRFWFNLQGCVCYHVGVCVCRFDKFC